MRLIDGDALQEEYVRLSGRELSLINDAPTVEPFKHGHWVYVGHGWAGEGIYKCSICGHHTPDNGNYCSYCGAKMDEVEE